MKSKLFTILTIFFLANLSVAQDVTVTAKINPSNGCDLTNSEQVSVVILNNSSSFIPSGSVTVSYTVNGTALTSEVLGANLANGATWNFNFSNANSADLSACGTHDFKVWVDLASDTNPNNDTLTFSIVNDCTIQPGNILTDMTVCELANQDTLRLDNWQHGTITDWEFSDNGGTSWNSLGGVTDTFFIFTNLTVDTDFRVVIDGGYCPNDTSSIASITLQTAPVAGTISGANPVCAANSSGTLTLNGNSGGVVQWESSTDNGSNWNTIANTTTTENYTNLTQTTWYRALVDGGVCPDVYSDTAFIYVETVTLAGTLSIDTSICYGDSANLVLDGKLGNVVQWESSVDGGGSWSNITHTDTTYNTGSLIETTEYRVIVQNGICPEDTSNVVEITVFSPVVVDAGPDQTITEGDTTQLLGSSGIIVVWYPGNGLSDTTIYNPMAYPTQTTTYTYTIISDVGCVGSDVVTITVEPAPDPIPPFDIKNVVTTNNDTYNDYWIIEGVEAYPNTEVTVYNIYGKEVYNDADYTNDWAATYDGNTLPNGTYMYVVVQGGTQETFKGNLTILGNE